MKMALISDSEKHKPSARRKSQSTENSSDAVDASLCGEEKWKTVKIDDKSAPSKLAIFLGGSDSQQTAQVCACLHSLYRLAHYSRPKFMTTPLKEVLSDKQVVIKCQT